MIDAFYTPKVYDVSSIDEAKKIILTPTHDATTEERWEQETASIINILRDIPIPRGSTVLDYGVGIGRIAKPLIEHFDCTVIGVDISPPMLRLSEEYVNAKNYYAWTPEQLKNSSVKADFALAIWILQHCEKLHPTLSIIKKTLKVGGKFFVLNDVLRCVPCRTEHEEIVWLHDNIDVKESLNHRFKLLCEILHNHAEAHFACLYEKQ